MFAKSVLVIFSEISGIKIDTNFVPIDEFKHIVHYFCGFFNAYFRLG